MLPDQRPFRGVQAKHCAPFVNRKHLTVVDGWSCTRAAFVILRVKARRESVTPEFVSVSGIEAPNDVVFVCISHCEQTASIDGKRRKSGSDGRVPKEFRSLRGKRRKIFGRDPVSTRSSPLRPVRCGRQP